MSGLLHQEVDDCSLSRTQLDSSELAHNLSPSTSPPCVLLLGCRDSSFSSSKSPNSSSEGTYYKLAFISHLNTVLVFLHCLSQGAEIFSKGREFSFPFATFPLCLAILGFCLPEMLQVACVYLIY